MKNILIILLGAVVIFGCTDLDLAEQGLGVEELPGYVAFAAPGSEVVLDTVAVTELSGTDETIFIENPTGTLSDITVNYEFGGTAVFGTDFTISGASAAGGSIVVDADPTDVQEFSREALSITFLTDAVEDGDKLLEITLVSASNAEGAMAVGRGGTELLRTVNIDISDVD